jgi:hypothetical protein
MLDDTLYTLQNESDCLLRLMDQVQGTTEQRNKIVKDTIIKLYKLIE